MFRVGGSVDAKRSVVSKSRSWDNFKNLRREGSLPAECLTRSVFWAFRRRKGSCVVNMSTDH